MHNGGDRKNQGGGSKECMEQLGVSTMLNAALQSIATYSVSGHHNAFVEVSAITFLNWPIHRRNNVLVSQASPLHPQHWVYCITSTRRKGLGNLSTRFCPLQECVQNQ